MASLSPPTSALLRHFLKRFPEFNPLRIFAQVYRSVQSLISVIRKSSDKRCPTFPASSSQSVPQFAAGLCPSAAMAPRVEPVSVVSSSSQHHSRPGVNADAVSLQEIDLSDPTLIIGGRIASPSQDRLEQGQSEIAFQASETESEWMLQPIMPEALPRRMSFKPISSKDPASYEVKCGQTSFKTEDRLPEGWVEHINSEGHPFFHQEEKNILTDAWLYDDAVQKFLVPLAYFIHSLAQERFPDVVQTCQLVVCKLQFPLEDDRDDGQRCGYYFARHQQRSLHWVENYDINCYLHDIKGGQIAPEHAKLQIECQYWRHFEYFDDVQQPTHADWTEFSGIWAAAYTDVLTSATSTCNHSLESLEKMRETFEILRTPDANRRASAWILGRFMAQFVKDRFINFYGQNGARLNSSDSVYGGEMNHSWLLDIFSPLLFNAPNVHLGTLENMWVDRVTRREPWKDLVAKLTTEWEQHKIFGTILLTTNAAFLAIPSVDSGGPGSPLVKLLSYLSTIAGLGCIILGSQLHRQYKTRDYSVMDAAEYLSSQNGKRGLEALAVMYSLPYALSMWGTIFFLAAFLVMCCFSESRMIATAIMGSWFILTFLILWSIKMAQQPAKSGNSWTDKRLAKMYQQWANNDYKGRILRFYFNLSSSIRNLRPGVRDLEAQNY